MGRSDKLLYIVIIAVFAVIVVPTALPLHNYITHSFNGFAQHKVNIFNPILSVIFAILWIGMLGFLIIFSIKFIADLYYSRKNVKKDVKEDD